MNGNTGYVGGHFCTNGHVFVCAGSMQGGRVPEGYPCSCGMYQAHWVKCPHCGQDKLEFCEAEGHIDLEVKR